MKLEACAMELVNAPMGRTAPFLTLLSKRSNILRPSSLHLVEWL